MKLTKKELQNGCMIKEGNIAIQLRNGAYMVRDYIGNWYGFEKYSDAKKEYLACIERAEYLGLQ